MDDFEKVLKDVEDRGETISPILPGAGWIFLQGNFTPKELRAVASEIESKFAKMMKSNVNKN